MAGGHTSQTVARASAAKHNTQRSIELADQTSDFTERFGLPSFEDNIFLIFGYGSILWKQEFEYEAEYVSYIKGYKRVFYQGTQSHRGTPGKPGRVVTLIPDADESRVYGKAYQLPSDPEKLFKILGALDVREQGGYDRVEVTLYQPQDDYTSSDVELDIVGKAHKEASDEEEEAATATTRTTSFDGAASRLAHTTGKNVVCLCYIATEDNEDYMGRAPMPVMAAEVLSRGGFSGTNREYLFFLADCLRAIGAYDPHVYELDATAKRLLAEGFDARMQNK